MDLLRPAYERLPEGETADRVRELEKRTVVTAITNLMTFPFVKAAVEDEALTLHGLWNDIANGGLEFWDDEKDIFVPL